MNRTLSRKLALLGAAALLALAAIGPMGVAAATGTVWTTMQTCATPDVDQNTNSYMVYETVHIRGTGFDPGTYAWDITATGKGGATIASGNYQVTSTDDFCVAAVLLLPAHEGGPYQATLGDKHDNFSVKGTAATAQPTPTPTPTPGSSGGTGASTLPPTDAVTGAKGSSDSLGLVLMLLAGVLASVLVLTPARARRR